MFIFLFILLYLNLGVDIDHLLLISNCVFVQLCEEKEQNKSNIIRAVEVTYDI